MTLLTLSRILVLVLESYSAVNGERAADHDLMKLCDNGEASMSSDFRTLCMKKRSERSAPILLKAILRACTTAFADFVEIFTNPWRLMMLILFTLTGVAAPVIKAFLALTVSHFRRQRRRRMRAYHAGCESGTDSDSEPDYPHEVVVVSPTAPYQGTRGATRLRMALRRGTQAFGMSRRNSTPLLSEPALGADSDEDDAGVYRVVNM